MNQNQNDPTNPDAPWEEAMSRDFDARLNTEDKPLGADGLKEALRTADALLCTVTDRLTAEPGRDVTTATGIIPDTEPEPGLAADFELRQADSILGRTLAFASAELVLGNVGATHI